MSKIIILLYILQSHLSFNREQVYLQDITTVIALHLSTHPYSMTFFSLTKTSTPPAFQTVDINISKWLEYILMAGISNVLRTPTHTCTDTNIHTIHTHINSNTDMHRFLHKWHGLLKGSLY